MNRLTWDEHYLKMCLLIADRSTCVSRHVGAILTIDNKQLVSGYNGVPEGEPHCCDIGCYRRKNNIPSGTQLDMCDAVHAEQNVIIQCARRGISLEGATLYCTNTPCHICAKMIANSGIKRVVYLDSYGIDDRTSKLFERAGIEFVNITLKKDVTIPRPCELGDTWYTLNADGIVEHTAVEIFYKESIGVDEFKRPVSKYDWEVVTSSSNYLRQWKETWNNNERWKNREFNRKELEYRLTIDSII